MLFSDLALDEGIVSRLEARGITAPTPIQQESIPAALEGRDVLGRARTGTGKTLAFSLPIAMRLEASRERGRAPRAIVLAPTRELAKQVAREFEQSASHLVTLEIYGGTSYGPQERELSRGVDVVVGTPGRVIDHLERGNLNLSQVEIAVLDEADEMLSMGFQEAVERILSATPRERQTILMSATMPHWVLKLVRQYQNNPVKIDLVGEDAAVTSTTQHVAIRVAPNARTKVLADLLTVYGPERAIVFTRTKRDCDELAMELIHRGLEAEAIHGDLAQAQRERALGAFRSGRARVLVATDVAARGLDVPEVDLVVQHHFPQDNESYVHRAGRTGRAGRAGTAVVLYTDREQRLLRNLEHATGVFFERKDPPKPQDVRAAAAANAAKEVQSVPGDAVAPFRAQAERLFEEYGLDALAAALARIAGSVDAPRPGSLITGEEGMTTLLLHSPRLSVPRAVAIIAKVTNLPSKAIGKIKPFQGGVAADVPKDIADHILSQSPLEAEITVERAETLPELIEMPRTDARYDSNRPRHDRGSHDRGGSGDRTSGSRDPRRSGPREGQGGRGDRPFNRGGFERRDSRSERRR